MLKKLIKKHTSLQALNDVYLQLKADPKLVDNGSIKIFSEVVKSSLFTADCSTGFCSLPEMARADLLFGTCLL